MIRQGCRFDEANDATADEADVAGKPAKAEEAEAKKANKTKAEEANAEAYVADEAIVANEIEANVIGKIIAADEAIVIYHAIAVDEINEAN